MAPSARQRTFEIIPNAPVLGQQNPGDDAQPIYSKPPMTTKQAKKLHNQKNKGPKLSKAEQRRIELMEQDRIRKEFEKEKAQARARTAREKKKAKEDKEKEERKRKGLPLVNIHPSQDTISRFISRVGRAIGVKRDSTAIHTLDSVREDSETVTDACESADDEGHEEDDESDKENQETVQDAGQDRPAKRRRLSQPDEPAGRTTPVASQFRAGPVAKIAQHYGAESYSRASSVDTDDPINQTLLEEQIVADVELASSRKTRSTNDECPEVSLAENPAEFTPQPILPTVPVESAPKEHSAPCPSSVKTQPTQRPIIPVRKDCDPKAQPASPAPSRLGHGAFKKSNSPYISAPPPGPTDASSAFKKPMVPPKFKNPAMRPSMNAERPRFLSKHISVAQQRQDFQARQLPGPASLYTLPTSTQAFLLENVDDLFPSPTQEARELSGTAVIEPPKPSINPPKLSINGPMFQSEAAKTQNEVVAPYTNPDSRLPAPVPEDFFDSSFISTQDFILSTQDILDIDTPTRGRQITAAPSLQTDNNGHSTSNLHVDRVEGNTSNFDVTLNTTRGGVEASIPRVEGNEKSSPQPVDAAPCCPNESFSGPCRCRGHKSSCRTEQNVSSYRVTQHEQPDQPTAESRPLQSSHEQHNAVTQQRSISNSNKKTSTTVPAPGSITTPDRPRAKRRMFGSSGPGPEGLVAMERSYQEMRRQERALEAQIHAQERLLKPAVFPSQQEDLDVAEFADAFLEDDFCESAQKNSYRRQSGVVQQEAGIQSLSDGKRTNTFIASQETDYGDIDGDDLDFLQGDTSWLCEDLDDI